MGICNGLEVSLIHVQRLACPPVFCQLTSGYCSYTLQWITVLPVEIIAGSLTIGYWNPDIPKSIFVTIFLVVILAINLLGIRGYGEAEFAFAIVKITAIVGFM